MCDVAQYYSFGLLLTALIEVRRRIVYLIDIIIFYCTNILTDCCVPYPGLFPYLGLFPFPDFLHGIIHV